MSMIETVHDVNNSFLSRREITCNFRGLAGKLKKSEAVDMITKEFKLSGKTVIAINLKNHTGRPNILGTFYVYDDENTAKIQVNPVIFERLEKQKAKDKKAGIAPTPVLNLPAGGYWRFDRKTDDEYQTKPSKEGWGIHDPLGHDGQDTFFKHPSVFMNNKGETGQPWRIATSCG